MLSFLLVPCSFRKSLLQHCVPLVERVVVISLHSRVLFVHFFLSLKGFLRNEGVPTFRLRASLILYISQKVERRAYTTYRKRDGHSREEGGS